jgi:tetratricopeptide (TPR) repeat protein
MMCVSRKLTVLMLAAAMCGSGPWSRDSAAADYSDVEQLYFSGEYEECLEAAAAEVERGVWNDRWPRLLIRCQLETGRYGDARATFEAAVRRHSSSLPLRLLGYDVYRCNNDPRRAEQELGRIFQLVEDAPWRFSSSENLVAIGRCFVIRGADARQILELFYDRVREADADLVEVYIATAELALAKHDYQVAAQTLEQAAKLAPGDPEIHYLLARSFQESDSEKASEAIAKALEINDRHVPSLLMLAEQRIDAEAFEEAAKLLTDILEVNLLAQEAWSLHAVIAHLEGHYAGEGLLRQAALVSWETNPQVDHLIGRKLSQNYRFREGAAYQRRALELDANYLPAQFQLGQDLLRLGEDKEGWEVTGKVYEQDAYNAVAHNLMTLHDRLEGFQVLRRGNLVVRMDAHEAQVYGEAVLDLLEEAWATLCGKYEVTIAEPVFVEIYPRQEDFAIRTFGLPGGAGFLGVCFGRVITANSPASQGDSPSNWRSVLWHEFCHVVTLEKTNNKMPRWLSEGISVYEERQKDPAWGQSMTPQYRLMILGEEGEGGGDGEESEEDADGESEERAGGYGGGRGGGYGGGEGLPAAVLAGRRQGSQLTPVSQLSGAFLRPPSPLHLQFAYYESSLVVEFLVEKHGVETLKAILDDLGRGDSINVTLERHVGRLAELDREFADYAQALARDLGNEVDWRRDELPEDADLDQLEERLEAWPNNYWGLKEYGQALVRAQRWPEARKVLERLYELYPEDTSPGNALELLAAVHRQTQDAPAEREALEELARLDCDSVDAYRRLMELALQEGDWPAVARGAERLLAVNPLLPMGHEMLARAAVELDRPQQAVGPLLALAEMDPIDPAAVHFRLAETFFTLGERDRARREVLKALEEAPRYRAAQKMLLDLVGDEQAAPAASIDETLSSEDGAPPSP